MFAGEFDALLLTVIFPVATPLEEGAKVEVNVVDCPGARISPLEPPVESNPAPATKTCEMVTLAFPALVSVTFWTLLLETLTLPKLKLLALELSNSWPAAETVSEAGLLVTTPAVLLTTTVNCAPLLEAVAAGVV